MYETTARYEQTSVNVQQEHARVLVQQFRAKRNFLAVGLVGLDVAIYLLSFCLGALSLSLWIKLSCGILCGLWIARLFVLGHDACHQSLTSKRPLNRLIGRLAFLPSLTPYSTWELAHNSIHHVFSNWSEKDYVWRPFSKNEFESLTLWRKGLERLYRNPFGHWLYYLLEIWWNRLLFPQQKYLPTRATGYSLDSILVSLVLLAQLAFLAFTAGRNAQSILAQILVLQLLPVLVQ